MAGQPGRGVPARAGVPGAVRGGARTGLRPWCLDPRLLARFPAEEYLCQLAILNHAATSDELTRPFAERFLERIAPDAAETVRRAMTGGIDGFRRWFLARQLVLRAMRLVLVPPPAAAGAAPDALEASLAGIEPETAAVLLVQPGRRRPLPGTPARRGPPLRHSGVAGDGDERQQPVQRTR